MVAFTGFRFDALVDWLVEGRPLPVSLSSSRVGLRSWYKNPAIEIAIQELCREPEFFSPPILLHFVTSK